MSNDAEIKVLLTAETTKLQAGMEAGAASVEKSTEAMTASVSKGVATQKTDLALLFDAISGNTKSVEALAEQQAALSRLQAAGTQSAATLTEATTALTAAAERLGVTEAEVAAATGSATAAVDENTVALGINGGVAREVGVLIGELARGNYARLEGSSVTLANRTGLLSTALSFLASPAGLASAAVAALGVAAYEAAIDEQKLEEAIINSGHASGFNADQMRTMEQALRDTGATAAQAREAVLAVAASGKLLGANFQNAAQAAVDMAQLTGVSIDKAVTAISRLQEDPVKAIMKLNETMNFLSPTEAQEIKHLQDIGDKAGAASIAIETLAGAEQKRVKEQNQAGAGPGFFGKVGIGWSDLWEGTKNIFSPDTLKEQLDQVNKEITQFSQGSPGAITQDANNKIHVDKSKMLGDFYDQVNHLLERRAELQAKITAEDEKQLAVSAQVAEAKAKVNATLSAPKPKEKRAGRDTSDHDQSQADRDAYNEQRLQHTMSLADEQHYWQAKKEAAQQGTQEYRQAVEQLLQIKNKETTAGREESRKEVADAKHSAEERIRAEKEVEREKERAAEKARQLSLEKLKDAHEESSRSIANTREQYQLEYSDGTISAQRLLQLEQDLVAQKLAIDKKYYADKEKLDAAVPIEIQKDDAGIVKAQQNAQRQMLASEKQFHANSQKEWQTYAKQIEGAMQGAINGMLFQHQTLRQALANVSLVIGEDFIRQAVTKPVNQFIEGEMAKTSAAMAGAAQRAIVDQTAAKASIAADAASGRSQITSAAATGAAKAYQAIVGIPYVGPILAPIAAGVAFAGIEAFGGQLSSARGGWERVPVDGMMTQLHKDEMVLPAPVADHVRNSMGGKGGSETHNHFHAMDVRSFTDAARRNERAFVDVIKKAHRNGRFGSR